MHVNKSRGFTLVELLVVLGIVAVLTTMAVPSFQRMLQTNAIAGGVNSFLGDLRYARSESIRRGGGVLMCRSDSPEASSPSCSTSAGSTGWASGWIVFHDLNNSGSWDSGDPILRVQAAVSGIDNITEGGSGSTKFVFTATGRLANLASATTLTFGGTTFPLASKRVVCVSLGGQARIAGDGNSACS